MDDDIVKAREAEVIAQALCEFDYGPNTTLAVQDKDAFIQANFRAYLPRAKFVLSRLASRISELEAALKLEKPNHRPGFWTHDDDAVAVVGHLYYFAPCNRAAPPYLQQRHVLAMIDIADDGTLAGVELVEDMPPPPCAALQAQENADG